METSRVRYTRRHIPADLLEKTLLNLPLKSLLRFSAVSKPWNAMILGTKFARRYRGREMVALRLHSSDQKALACPISDVSTDRATPLSLPFRPAESYSDVSCGELRCVELGNTLCLYNPSTRAHRKLPPPSCSPRIGTSMPKTAISVFVYGLGYDAAANDYKIIKARRDLRGETEIYSLRSDSWREVVDCRKRILSCISDRDITATFHTHKGVFVGGAVHWIVRSRGRAAGIWVLSFDVSKEEFRKAAPPLLPERLVQSTCSTDQMDVAVLNGRVCVWGNFGGRFSVWAMMEDCSWSKDMEIDYSNIYPLRYSNLTPLYFYDSDRKAIKAVTSCTDIRKMFIYKDEGEEIVEKKFGGSSSNGYGVVDSFTYVENLVSPFPDHNYCHVKVEVEEEEGNEKVKRGGMCYFFEDPWAAYRGKYPNPTYKEWKLILKFLVKLTPEDENFVEEDSKSWIRFKERLQRPNLHSSFLDFLRQVRDSKGYNVDSDIDFSVSPSWKSFGVFVPRSLDVEKFYDEAMAASKFAVERINDHMCSMKRGNRYEVVSVEKLVSKVSSVEKLVSFDILLLTFTAKETSTADLEIFQAMVTREDSIFELNEWKFKPIPL